MDPNLPPLSPKQAVEFSLATIIADDRALYATSVNKLLSIQPILSTVSAFDFLKIATDDQITTLKGRKSKFIGKEFIMSMKNAFWASDYAHKTLFVNIHNKLEEARKLLSRKTELLEEKASLEENLRNLNSSLEGKTPEEQQEIANQILPLGDQISENQDKLSECEELEQLYTAYNLNQVTQKYFDTVNLVGEEGSRMITREMVDAQFELIDAYRSAKLAGEEVDLPAPVLDRAAIEKAFEDAHKAFKVAKAAKKSIDQMTSQEAETREAMKKIDKIQSLSSSLYIFLCVISFGILALDLFFTKKIFAAKIGIIIKMDKAKNSFEEAKNNFKVALEAKNALPSPTSLQEEVMLPAEEVRPPVVKEEVTGESKTVSALKVGGTIAAVGAAVLAGPLVGAVAASAGLAYLTNIGLKFWYKS